MITVTVSLRRDEDNNRVKAFIYQDAPEFRDYGDYADLAQHEVLELLDRLGLNQQESASLLGLVLQEPPSVRRRQFQLSPEQETKVRGQFFPSSW
jgi:hypothetical protein